MRKWTPGLAVVMLSALMGCTIQIPGQLLSALNPRTVVDGTPASVAPVDVNPVDPIRQFTSADTSADKRLDFEEFLILKVSTGLQGAERRIEKAQVQEEFNLRDQNRDRFLTLDEFVVPLPLDWGMKGPSPKPRPTVSPLPLERCEDWFKRADVDRDARLSLKEFLAISPDVPRLASLITRCAAPPDRENRELEVPSRCLGGSADAVTAFSKGDLDGDGVLNLKEFCVVATEGPNPQPPPVADDCKSVFKRADADGDGIVTFEEFSRADYRRPDVPGVAMAAVMPSEEVLRTRFKGLDRNRDGRLDLEEWCEEAETDEPDAEDSLCSAWPFGDDDSVDFSQMYEHYLRESAANDAVPGEPPVGFKDKVYERFKGLDRNQDGRVTQEEYCQPFNPPPPPVAEGDITCHELRWPVPATEALSIDAYAKWRFSAVRFIQAPSESEVADFLQKYAEEGKTLDRDGDGRITLQEERASCEGKGALQ